MDWHLRPAVKQDAAVKEEVDSRAKRGGDGV
jgi:hypothetical protein